MKNCVNVWKVSNEGVDWVFSNFQAIKETSDDFTINKILPICVGNMDGFKGSDAVEMSIHCGSEYDMVLNTTLDVLSIITCGGYNF